MTILWVGERSLLDCSIGLAEDRRILQGRWLALLMWLAICNSAAFAYLKIQAPQYVATIQLLLEPLHVANDGPEDLRHFHQLALDSAQSETDLRTIRSERVLRRVFDRLAIADDIDVLDGPDGIWPTTVRTISRLSRGGRRPEGDERAFLTFSDRVRSRRLGLSYVVEISYRASRPAFARHVVGAVAASYLHERILAAIDRLQVSGLYRTDRLQGMRDQLAEADAAIGNRPFLAADLTSADVRVLGLAARPTAPTFPKVGPLLALANGLGLIIGILGLLLRGRTKRARAPASAQSKVYTPAAPRVRAGP